MFELIFGWRKASKCKKLIRKVQCRLRLLRNKRCCIAKQLRDDVSELLKHGHHQTAFDRVEQIFIDECIVTVYDLLGRFCEFVIIHLSYIRRHKDCPDDINEAVSSLIFASARCGDLPELRKVRNLFGDRYGHHFMATALDLLPGNLVNTQIRENLSIKSVPKDAKYKLVDEIARSCLQRGPLALEHSSELHQWQGNASIQDDPVLSFDQIPGIYTENSRSQLSDTSSELKKFEEKICQEMLESNETPKEMENIEYSSSGNSSNVPEEMIYVDDIQEFEYPLSKDEEGQDQRVFVFRTSVVPARKRHKVAWINNDGEINKYRALDNKQSPTRSRKWSVSLETRAGCVKDIQCAIYYNTNFHRRKVYPKKIENKACPEFYPTREREAGSENGRDFTCDCSSENRCYLHISDSEKETFELVGSPCPLERKGTRPSTYARAMTMPNERPKQSCVDNMERSNSLLVQDSIRGNNGSSVCSHHVHPKLPDYDELAAKFMAIKKANMENNHK